MKGKRRPIRKKKQHGLFLAIKLSLVCYLAIFGVSYMTSDTSAYFSSQSNVSLMITAEVPAKIAPVTYCGEEIDSELGDDLTVDGGDQVAIPKEENESETGSDDGTAVEMEDHVDASLEDTGSDAAADETIVEGEGSLVTPQVNQVSEPTVEDANQGDSSQDLNTNDAEVVDGTEEIVTEDQVDVPIEETEEVLDEEADIDCEEINTDPNEEIIAECKTTDEEIEEENELAVIVDEKITETATVNVDIEIDCEQEPVQENIADCENSDMESKEENDIDALSSEDINADCKDNNDESNGDNEQDKALEDEVVSEEDAADVDANREEELEKPEEGNQTQSDYKDETENDSTEENFKDKGTVESGTAGDRPDEQQGDEIKVEPETITQKVEGDTNEIEENNEVD